MGVRLCRSTYQMQTIFWIRSSFSGSLKSFHLGYHHLGPHNRGRYHSDSGKSPSSESHPFRFLWSPDSLGGLSALCFGILVLPFAEQHMKLRVCTPPPPTSFSHKLEAGTPLRPGSLLCSPTKGRGRKGRARFLCRACMESWSVHQTTLIYLKLLHGARLSNRSFLCKCQWRNASSVFIEPEKWGLVPYLPGVYLCTDE